jgi:FkbM family methyltransferase
MWGDDKSRAFHIQFIAWRYLRQDWTFTGATVDTTNRYFIDEVIDFMRPGSSFLDIGCHNGQVINKFIEKTNCLFSEAWLVEPDKKNLEELKLNLGANSMETCSRIKIFDVAVGEVKGKLTFYSGLGYASQFSGISSDEVQVITIDSLGLSPSIIKIHIEGSEIAAVIGAMETIKKFKPLIMLTTYHNEDGIWLAPSHLKRLLSQSGLSYEFIFRMHSWVGTGGVIYAIPTEGCV